MSDNVQVIRNFIPAWSKLDAEEVVENFTEDGKIKVWRDYFDMATFTKPFVNQ